MPPISSGLFALGDHDQGRAQHAVRDHVALLQHGDHGVGFLVGIDHADGLVLVRVELLAGRIDFVQGVFLEGGNQLLEGQLDAGLEALHRLFRHGQGGFQAVLDGQQFAGKLLDGKLVGLGNIFLGAAADVFAFGLGAQPGVVMLGGLPFAGLEWLLLPG